MTLRRLLLVAITILCFNAIGQTTNTVVLSGQSAVIVAPTNSTYGVVIYHHGVGEDAFAILNDALKTNLVSQIARNGWLVAGSDANGENWGNDASINTYSNLIAYIQANYAVDGRMVFFSQSMGGQSGLVQLSMRSDVQGWFGIYPVCNLTNMYAGFGSEIRTAYGIAADSSDYAEKTAGHDPVLLSGSLFTGKRMRFYASYSDTVVAQDQNTDRMRTNVAAYATESGLVQCTGDHGDTSHFQIDDVLAFLSRCTVNATTHRATIGSGTLRNMRVN